MNIEEMQQLKSGLEDLNIPASDKVLEKFQQYLELLQKWNKAYNLTTITDPKKIITHHFLDSVSIYPYLHGTRIADVGCGAGFPGIPLALISDKQFYLVESLQKKVSFLIQAIHELQLSNVQVIHQRAEEYFPERCFDSVITRAFSTLDKMLSLTGHLCCPTGKFLAMKGKFPVEEIEDISANYQVETIQQLDVPELKSDRHLVLIIKKSPFMTS